MFDFNLPAFDPSNPNALLTTPADIQRRQAMADALLKQGTDYSPVASPWQGAARLAQALLGGYQEGQLERERKQGTKEAQDTLGGLLTGTAGASNPVPSPNTPVANLQPRGIRNNNPLNIESGTFTQSQPGYVGSDGRFAQFSSPEAGVAAANTLLDTYQNKYGLNTINGIVSRWAPAGDGNDVRAYAADVAKQLGISPDAPIPQDMRSQLIAAMGQHENGKPVQVASLDNGPVPERAPTYTQSAAVKPTQVAQAQPQLDTAKLMAVLNNPYATPAQQQIATALLQKQITQNMEEPELKTITDLAGQQHLYRVNKRTGETSEVTPNGPSGAPAQYASASGASAPSTDVLAAAEKQYPGVTNRVEQLYRGEGGMPNKRTNPLDGAALQLIQRVHPDWNMTMWTAKNKMQQQLSSSSAQSLGGRLQALRNAFDHLANTSDAALEKGNVDAGISPLSTAVNAVKSLTTNQRDLASKLEREAVTYGGERTKFLTGAEGSEAERRAFLDSLGPNTAAPPQMAGTIEGEYTQLKSALLNQEQQIREQLGDDYLKKHPIVTPEVKQALARIEKNIGALRGKGKVGGATAESSAAKTLAPVDQQALDWASANPNDPRAAQIKARLGVK